jgi:hypothetical protein
MRNETTLQPTLPEPATRQAERGAVLAISLILLTIMMLLAISSMRTATLGLIMTGNAQHRESAFQLAQTGIAATINALNNDRLELVAEDGWTHPAAISGREGETGDAYHVDLRYLYRALSPVQAEPGETEALFFELEATGMTGGRNARSLQTRGFWVTGVDERPINVTYWFPHESP